MSVRGTAARVLWFAAWVMMFAACGSFDDPTYVYDMRILGAIAEPPEVLVPADPEEIDPLALPEVEVCVLVADPGDSRELSYKMVACPPNEQGRCDEPGVPQFNLGSGSVADPEEALEAVEICEVLGPNPLLADVLEESIELSSVVGFGAIDIQVGIEVWPAGSNLDQAIYGTKRVRFGLKEPEERLANENPEIESISVARDAAGPRGLGFSLPQGRCGDIEAPLVAPGESLQLLPVEPEGARQEYVVPTFDGGSRSFTENIRYAFFSTEGRFSNATTGGDRDITGRLPPLHTNWTAPRSPEVIGNGLDISFYVIQRDERGGQSWFQSCVRVLPL